MRGTQHSQLQRRSPLDRWTPLTRCFYGASTVSVSEPNANLHLSLEEHTYIHKHVDALTVRIRAAVYGSNEIHPTERHEDGEDMDAAEQSTPAFEGATDGSMRELGPLSRKTPLAGAAWAIWPANTTQVLPLRYGLHHIHSRANFSSPDAYTSGDPCKLSSTHTEVAGIHPTGEGGSRCRAQGVL